MSVILEADCLRQIWFAAKPTEINAAVHIIRIPLGLGEKLMSSCVNQAESS